jgi:hypothetical protein
LRVAWNLNRTQRCKNEATIDIVQEEDAGDDR